MGVQLMKRAHGLAVALAMGAAVSAAAAQRANEWAAYGHDAGGVRFSPLKQIQPKNVGRLRAAWTFHTGERELGLDAAPSPPGFQSTPLVVDGVLYVTSPSSRVFALDAETGRERWRFDPQAGASPRRGQTRGSTER